MTKLTVECQLVVDHIIKKTNEYNFDKTHTKQIALTIKRIQNILFLIQIEHIKHTGETIFEDDFYAYQTGPTIPAVYDKYLKYTTGANSPVKNPQGTLSQHKRNIIDSVLEITNNIATLDLIHYCCTMDNLWSNAYNPNAKKQHKIILKSSMFKIYHKRQQESMTMKIKKLKTR